MRSARPPSLARSTAFNLAGLLVPTVVQLVTVPLYIRFIGLDRYGVMALVWLLLGYFGVFDLGFGRAVASRIATLGDGTAAARAEVFWTGTCLSVLTGAVGGLVLYVVARTLFGNVFDVPRGLIGETAAALPFVALALPLVTGISAMSGALQGREAFGAMNMSQMTGSILYQVFPLLTAMLLSPTLPGLVIAAVGGRAVTAAMLLWFCLRRVPAEIPPRIALAEVKPLLSYGSWVTVTGLIYPLLTVFDRFVIGAITGMAAVAAYTIPFNLVTRIAALPASFQNALFPRFAALDEPASRALQARAAATVACMMTPILIIGLLLIRPFMTLWIGEGLAARAAPVGQVLVLGLWFSTMGFVPFSFLQSRGRPDVPAKLHVLELLGYAPVLYLLTLHFGVVGAAWAWGARALADTALLFAAVGLWRQLLVAWPGLLLLLLGFALVATAVVTPWLQAGAGAALVAASLFWSAHSAPRTFRDKIFLTLKRLAGGRGARVDSKCAL